MPLSGLQRHAILGQIATLRSRFYRLNVESDASEGFDEWRQIRQEILRLEGLLKYGNSESLTDNA